MCSGLVLPVVAILIMVGAMHCHCELYAAMLTDVVDSDLEEDGKEIYSIAHPEEVCW